MASAGGDATVRLVRGLTDELALLVEGPEGAFPVSLHVELLAAELAVGEVLHPLAVVVPPRESGLPGLHAVGVVEGEGPGPEGIDDLAAGDDAACVVVADIGAVQGAVSLLAGARPTLALRATNLLGTGRAVDGAPACQCESGGEKGSCRQGAPDGACSGHVRSSRLKGLWKNLSRTCSKRKRPAEPTDGSPRAEFIGSAPTQGSLNPAFPSGSARDGRADLVAAGEVQAHLDRVGGVGAEG